MEDDDLEQEINRYDSEVIAAEDIEIDAMLESIDPTETTEELENATSSQIRRETHSIEDYQDDEFADTIEAKDYAKKEEKFSDWRNSFYNAVDRIQQSGYKGDANKSQNEIDLIEKSLEENNQLTPSEREKLESEVIRLRGDMKEHLDDVNDEQDQIDEYGVSEEFKQKQEHLLQEEKSMVLDYLKYELPEELGGTASQFGLLAGQALKNKFGDKIIRGFVENAAKRAVVGLELGEAAPFVTAALVTYDVASVAADMYMMYQMRERETAAEANDAYEQNLQAKTMEYMQANGLQDPSQLSESEQRDLRIEANKGLEEFKDKQMMASLGDVMSFALVATPWGGAVHKLKNFSRLTRLGSTVGAIGANIFEEMTEEGYQFRLTDQFLAGKMRDDKSWLNTIGEGFETWKDDALESAGLDDEYSTDVDYRNAKRSGGLLGGLMGGVMTSVGTAKEEMNYEKLNDYNQKNLNNYFGPAQAAFKAKKFSQIINDGQSEMFRESMRNMKEGASVNSDDIDKAVKDFDVAESIHESLEKSRMFKDNPELSDRAFQIAYTSYEVLNELSAKNKQLESNVDRALSDSNSTRGSFADLNARKKAVNKALSQINSFKNKPSNIVEAKKELESELKNINKEIKEIPASERSVKTLASEEYVVDKYFELYQNKFAQKEDQKLRDDFSNPKKAYELLKDSYTQEIKDRAKAIKKEKAAAKKKIAEAKTPEEVKSVIESSKESIKDITPEEAEVIDSAVEDSAIENPVQEDVIEDDGVIPLVKQSNAELKEQRDALIDGEGFENVPEEEVVLRIDELNEELDGRDDKSDNYVPEDEIPAEETTPVNKEVEEPAMNKLLKLAPAAQGWILKQLVVENIEELASEIEAGSYWDMQGTTFEEKLNSEIDSLLKIYGESSEANSQQVDEEVPVNYEEADKKDTQSKNLDETAGKDNREDDKYTGAYKGFRLWLQDKVWNPIIKGFTDRPLGVLKNSVYVVNYEYANTNNINAGDKLEFFSYVPDSKFHDKSTGTFYERVRKTQLNSGVGDGLAISDKIPFGARNFSIGIKHGNETVGFLPYVPEGFDLNTINLSNYRVESFDEPIQPTNKSLLVSFGGYTLNEIQSILDFRTEMYKSLGAESIKNNSGNVYTHTQTSTVGEVFKGRLNTSETYRSPSEVFRKDTDNKKGDPIVYAVSDANGSLTIPNEEHLTDDQAAFAKDKKIWYNNEKLTPSSVYVLMPAGNGDVIPIKTFIQRINVLDEASRKVVLDRVKSTLKEGANGSMGDLKTNLLSVVGITAKNITVYKDSLVFNRKGASKTLNRSELATEEGLQGIVKYLSEEFVSIPFSRLNRFDFNQKVNSDNSLKINITPYQYVHSTTITTELGKAEVTSETKPEGFDALSPEEQAEALELDRPTDETIEEMLEVEPVFKQEESSQSSTEDTAVVTNEEINKIAESEEDSRPVVDLTGRKTFPKESKTKKEKLKRIHKRVGEIKDILTHIIRTSLEDLEYFQNRQRELDEVQANIDNLKDSPEYYVADNFSLLARTKANLKATGSANFEDNKRWFVEEGSTKGANYESLAGSIYLDSITEDEYGNETSSKGWSSERDVSLILEEIVRTNISPVAYKAKFKRETLGARKDIYTELSSLLKIEVNSKNLAGLNKVVDALVKARKRYDASVDVSMKKLHDDKMKPKDDTEDDSKDDTEDDDNPYGGDDVGNYRLFSVDDMTGESFDNEQELNWLSEVLGIPVELVNSMKEVAASGGVEAWGMFANSMIYLMKSNIPGTTYHEAFHAVFRLMLNKEQRAKIMKEAKGPKGFKAPTSSQLAALKKLHPKLNNEAISDLYYEEEMANAFMEYNLTDGLTAKSLPKQIADWFKKMYLAAKLLVTGNLNMREYFFMINKGYYKNKQFSRDVSKFEDQAAFSVPNMNGIETKRSVDILNKQLLLDVVPEEFKGKDLAKVLSESSNPLKTLNRLYNKAHKRVDAGFNGHKKDNKFSENYKAVKNSEEYMANHIAAYKEIQHMAIRDLGRFGIYINPSTNSLVGSSEFFGDIIETDEVRGTLEGWMTDNFSISAMDSLSEQLRIKLNYFPMMDENGHPKKDNGFPVYEDGFKFAQFLIENIHDSFDVGELTDGKYSKFTMMGKLVEASNKKGSIKKLVEDLQKDKNLTTDLFTAFAGKTRPEFYNFTQDENGQVNMGISNKANKADVLKSHLADSFMSLTNKQVEKYPEYIKELKTIAGALKDGTDSIEHSQNRDKFLKIANVFGLDFYSDEIDNAPNKIALNKAMSKMASHLTNLLEYGKKLPSGNPMIDGNIAASNYELGQLSKVASVYKNSLTEDSFRDMNGKSYYSHVFPSFLAKQLWRLSKLGDVNNKGKGIYSDDSFYTNSEWFNNIVTNKKWNIGSDIKYGFLDGFKRNGDTQGTKYTKMSPNQLMSTFISAWSNNSITTNGGKKMSFFPTSILADGGQMMMFGVPYETRAEHTNTLVGVLKQEANRIIKEDKENKLPYKRKNEFLFDVSINVAKKIKAENPELTTPLEIANKMIKIIDLNTYVEEAMSSDFQKFLDKLVDIQVLKQTEQGLVINENSIDESLAKHDLNEELKNFYYAFTASQSQITTLLAGDPAFYGGNEDFFKRVKQIYSPGTFLDLKAEFTGKSSGVFEENGLRENYNTVYLRDVKARSKHADTIYNNLLKANTNPDLALKIASKYGYKHSTATTIERMVKGEKKLVEVNIDSNGQAHDIELVNSTDAQAYVGLERYREIMIGRNKWSQTMEDALPNLIAGTATPAQLRLVMQPIKPFMFDHILSHGTVVPSQHKNSEFLLLPQLAKGNEQLEDILKGMGHVFGETPSFNKAGKLYDSVQFESAIKVGGSRYAENTKSITKANVHTIKNESYRIQMETPEHHVDYKGLFGVQVRKNVMGDINKAGTYVLPDGSEINGAEMYAEYEDLLSADIKAAFESIEEDFTNEDGTPNVKRASEAIQAEMNKIGLGQDFIDAVAYVEEGNKTKLPLYHPLISAKVENVILAMFRNKVVKRKINGGSFINATSFGLSEELKIRWNEDGTIKHYEAIMPAWTKQFVNEEGFFDISMLDEESRNAIMYRIPNEDFYSIFNIKVIDFTPSDSGGVIMLPSEVTTVAGLDFDVDKLFAMFYALKKGKNGKFSKVEYDRNVSKSDYSKRTKKGRKIVAKYQSELNRLFDNKKLFKNDAGKIKSALVNFKSELEALSKNSQVIDAMFPNADIVSKTEDVLEDIKVTEAELKEIAESIDNSSAKISELLSERAAELNDIVADEEFNKLSDIDKNSQEARDNRKIDIIRAVLTNKHSLEKQLNPGNFDELKGFVDEYKNLSEDNNLNVDNPLSLLEMHSRNMTGRELTGIFANHVSSHIMFQHHKLNYNKPLTWNGIPYNSIDDYQRYNNGGVGRISKTLASLLAAVLDNAKDPTASFLNINTYTADMYATAIRLGIPLKDIVAFFNRPIIREFTKLYYNYGGDTAAEKRAKKFIIEKYGIEPEENFSQLDISVTASDDVVFNSFMEFKKSFSSPLGKATNAFRLDKKKSSRVADIIKTKRDVLSVIGGKAISGLEEVIDIKKTSMGAFYQHGTIGTLSMFGKLTNNPFVSFSYSLLFDDVSNQIVGDVNADEINEINHEIMNALFISDKYFSEDKEYLLKEFPIELEIEKLKHSHEYEILKYLGYIPAENSSTNYAEIGSNSISDIPDAHLQYVKDSWNDMHNNPETSETAINLAKYALMKSGFKRSRGSISHLIPVDLLNNMIDENNVSINDRFESAVNVISGAYNESLTEKFYNQYVRNNYEKLRFVREAKIDEDFEVVDSTEEGIPSVIKMTEEFGNNNTAAIDEGTKYMPTYIKVKQGDNTYLYEVTEHLDRKILNEGGQDFAKYKLIDTLGVNGVVKEYDLYQPLTTAFSDNKVTSGIDEPFFDSSKASNANEIGKTKKVNVLNPLDVRSFNSLVDKRNGVLPPKVSASRSLVNIYGEGIIWIKDKPNDINNTEYSLHDLSKGTDSSSANEELIESHEANIERHTEVLLGDEKLSEERVSYHEKEIQSSIDGIELLKNAAPVSSGSIIDFFKNVDLKTGLRTKTQAEAEEVKQEFKSEEDIISEVKSSVEEFKKSRPKGLKEVKKFKFSVNDSISKGIGTGADISMRENSDAVIFEGDHNKGSVGKSAEHFGSSYEYNKEVGHLGSSTFKDNGSVMLTRSGRLSGQPLTQDTKSLIDLAKKGGNEFLVGDMIGVDSAFIEYLEKIGATYSVYSTGVFKSTEDFLSRISISMHAENVDKLLDGTKTTTVRAKEIVPVGQTKTANIGGVEFNISNRGELTIEEAGGVEAILKSEGLESKEDALFPTTKKWLNGNGKLFVYDVTPVDKISKFAARDWKSSEKRDKLIAKEKAAKDNYSDSNWANLDEWDEDSLDDQGFNTEDEWAEDETPTSNSDVDFVNKPKASVSEQTSMFPSVEEIPSKPVAEDKIEDIPNMTKFYLSRRKYDAIKKEYKTIEEEYNYIIGSDGKHYYSPTSGGDNIGETQTKIVTESVFKAIFAQRAKKNQKNCG